MEVQKILKESCSENRLHVDCYSDDVTDIKIKLITLSLSLLMAAVLQAISSLGSVLQGVFQMFHWNVES